MLVGYQRRQDKRAASRAEDLIRWTALGSALAARGEPVELINQLCLRSPTRQRDAMLKGYYETSGNRPVPISDYKPTRTPFKTTKRTPQPQSWEAKKTRRWVTTTLARQKQQREAVMDNLRAGLRPHVVVQAAPFGRVEEHRIFVRPIRSLLPFSQISEVTGPELRARIEAMGFTMSWWGRRNGIARHNAIRLGLMDFVPTVYVLLVDREELMLALACLMDEPGRLDRPAVYKLLRQRFERLP